MKKNFVLFGLGFATTLSLLASAGIDHSYSCTLGLPNVKEIEVGETYDYGYYYFRYTDGEGKNGYLPIDGDTIAAINTADSEKNPEKKLGYSLTSLAKEANKEYYLRYDSAKKLHVVDFYFVNPGTFVRKLEGSIDCGADTNRKQPERAAGAHAMAAGCRERIDANPAYCANERRGEIMARELGDEVDASKALRSLDGCLEKAVGACVAAKQAQAVPASGPSDQIEAN